MNLNTRKILDRAFSGLGLTSIFLLAGSLLVLLLPIIFGGFDAFVFKATIEHRAFQADHFNRGDKAGLQAQLEAARQARRPVFEMIERFRDEMKEMRGPDRRYFQEELQTVISQLNQLIGPLPGQQTAELARTSYGTTRWDRAQEALTHLLYVEQWTQPEAGQWAEKSLAPRATIFAGTTLEPMFDYVQANLDDMLLPQWTFYWQFLTDEPIDDHMFGGIWPMILGTIYLTIAAMVFAVPLGVLTAIYLVEYARQSWAVDLLRTCISTLAGVPSVVFGLFGMAFFIRGFDIAGYHFNVSDSKSVLAGALTLGLLVLPTVIRAAEEALKAVPQTYKEAALSLGAGRWRTVLTVVLPAALPGVLTGTIISMGRAAGETAPIIFTAAVSTGVVLAPWQLDQATSALPWNIYAMVAEHKEREALRHVQYGMVMVLISIVLLLNIAAILLRARISRKLHN